jgi:hypothetical protein
MGELVDLVVGRSADARACCHVHVGVAWDERDGGRDAEVHDVGAGRRREHFRQRGYRVRANVESLVVGETATADLPADTGLVKGMITRGVPAPAAGQQVVGVALKPGTVPLAQLTPGRDVAVIEVPAPSQQQQRGTVDPFAATGYVIVPSARGSILVTDSSQADASSSGSRAKASWARATNLASSSLPAFPWVSCPSQYHSQPQTVSRHGLFMWSVSSAASSGILLIRCSSS